MSRNFSRSPWAALAAIWCAATGWLRRAREELRDDEWDDDPLTFVVLEFPSGTHTLLPLPADEALWAWSLEMGAVELGRTSDPQELERLMQEGRGSDERE